MKVTCTGRRVTLKPTFVERAEAKLSRMDKFFPGQAEAKVTVNVEKHRQTVEITVRDNGLTLRAEKASERMEDALDDAIELLQRRVVKNRKRLGDKLTSTATWPADAPAAEPEESFDVIREKRFAVRPCSTEEAILQMNLLDHSFFLYRNAEDGQIQVVYRRADGGYGVLIPQE